ncbi:MAG: M23 family metallopeptidase [Candidatus Glassbacteria bacterium]
MWKSTVTSVAGFISLLAMFSGWGSARYTAADRPADSIPLKVEIIKRADLAPGEAAIVEVMSDKETVGVTGEAFGKRIIFWEEVEGRFRGLIGFDRDIKAGIYDLRLTLHTRTGADRELTEKIQVEGKEFRIVKLRVPPKPGGLTKEDIKRIRLERALTDSILSLQREEKLWNRPFIPPLERLTVTEDFGTGRIINGRRRDPHGGLDLRARAGTPVKASNDGIVAFCGQQFYSGKSVFIDHGLGVYSMYFHFDEILVKQGERVRRGQVIGTVGSTGRSTGPHLHWAFQINRARIDPLSIISLPMNEAR